MKSKGVNAFIGCLYDPDARHLLRESAKLIILSLSLGRLRNHPTLLTMKTAIEQDTAFPAANDWVPKRSAPSVLECRLINLRKIGDCHGHLSVVEGEKDIPFDIKRIYYLYDVPAHSTRGRHAHRNLQQLFIAMSGRFEITLRDGESAQQFSLNRPDEALYVPPMIWRDIDHFTPGAVCLVLASDSYHEDDYIRDYESYLAALGEGAG